MALSRFRSYSLKSYPLGSNWLFDLATKYKEGTLRMRRSENTGGGMCWAAIYTTKADVLDTFMMKRETVKTQ